MATEADFALTAGQEHANRKVRRAAVARAREGAPINSDGEAATAQPGSFDRFMPRAEVISATGLSDTTLWREYRAGRFPKPVPLTKNRVGWLESQVRAWMASRLREAQAR